MVHGGKWILAAMAREHANAKNNDVAQWGAAGDPSQRCSVILLGTARSGDEHNQPNATLTATVPDKVLESLRVVSGTRCLFFLRQDTMEASPSRPKPRADVGCSG